MTTTGGGRRRRTLLALAAAGALWPGRGAQASVTFVVNNLDGPGQGFNDPTPAAPVGGNSGTTLGQQRLNAFMEATSIWGQLIDSYVPVVIDANFGALSCTASSITLAGPRHRLRVQRPGVAAGHTFPRAAGRSDRRRRPGAGHGRHPGDVQRRSGRV
jgi:hypothetical protein